MMNITSFVFSVLNKYIQKKKRMFVGMVELCVQRTLPAYIVLAKAYISNVIYF